MRLTFAGCGSAFTIGQDSYQSNVVMTVQPAGQEGLGTPRHMLIDCGSDARLSLPRIGITQPSDIDAIYITHTHADHIGGLEWLALSCRYGAVRRRPLLLVPAKLREALWKHSLAGGLMITEEGPATLETYFEVSTVETDHPFSWEGIECLCIPVLHVDGGSVRMMSYGLLLRADGRSVYFSSDAKFDASLATRDYAQKADIIFHDCETGPRSGVHAHYEDLRTLPLELRQKMWLYHYNPGPLPDARAEGFRGFVQTGQQFDLQHPQTL